MIAERIIVDPMKREKYPEDPDFCFGLEVVQSVAGSHHLELLEHTAMVILNAACLASGQLETALNFLKEHGFTPVYARLMLYTEETVRKVWFYQLHTFRPDRWQLILDLLLIGPSLLVLLQHKQPTASSAAAQMKALKGPSDPILGEPHQLRMRLGALNKIINLVHSAEEPGDVVREMAIFLRPPELKAAWKAASAALNGNERSLDTRNLLHSMQIGVRPGGVSFAHISVSLRWRLFEALSICVPDQDNQMLSAARSALESELAWMATSPPTAPLKAVRDYQHRFCQRKVLPLLQDAVRSSLNDTEYATYVQALLVAFAEIESGLCPGRCDLNRLWSALKDADFLLDPWEHLVLATHEVTRSLRVSPWSGEQQPFVDKL